MKKITAFLIGLFFLFCTNVYAKEKIEYNNPKAGIYILKINTKKL